MIHCNQLGLSYGSRHVLSGVDCTLSPGEFVALLGPNGSGKTTLLGGIGGVIPPKTGSVELDGESLSRLSPKNIARKIAFVPQRVDTMFGLSVRTLVEMGRYARLSFWGRLSTEDHAAVDQAMGATGTLEFHQRPVDELSGGELQRVLLARALAQETPLLLLDEPFSAMDASWRIHCMDLLRRHSDHGGIVLMAMHDLNLAALYCGRMLFLKSGSMILDGTLNTVFTEENLSKIYETKILVGPHPALGLPQAFAMPGSTFSAS